MYWRKKIVQHVFVLLVWHIRINNVRQGWSYILHMFLNYFWLVFYMPIACAQLSRCHHRTQFDNLSPLDFDINPLTLYLTLNITITINSDNFPTFYILRCGFTLTWPSYIWFRYFFRLELFPLSPLQFILNIISNSDSKNGILNFLLLQCFGNIIFSTNIYLHVTVVW